MDNLHNINIEKLVLSSIIYYPQIFEEVSEILKADDFYLPNHKYIYEAMQACEQEDLPIDVEFIEKKLLPENKFDENVMVDIGATSPIYAIKPYAQELQEKSIKRELIKLTGEITKITVEKDFPIQEILDSIQQKLYGITQEVSKKEFKEASEIVLAAMARMKEIKARGNSNVVGLDTGYRELNNLTAGFGNGDLIIVAARPAMGKTSFCLNLAQKILDNNKGVAIFSLEMPAEHLMLRMLSAKTSIPLQKLRVGDLTDDQWENLSHASDKMSEKLFFIDDNGNVDIHHVRAKLRKLKAQYPEVSLCVIDYLQLMTGNNKRDRHIEVSEISRGLKLLARELDMPIIALSQLNRGLEARHDKRPMLSDLRESGSIEQDADLILFVYRDDIYKQREEREKEKKAKSESKEYRSEFFEKPEEEAEIIIGKNRNGPVGVANMIFQKAFTRFIDKSFSPPVEILYQGEKETQFQMPEL